MKDGNLYREIQRLTAENEVFQHDCTKAAEALQLLKTKLAAAYNAFDHLIIVCFQHADRTRERDAHIKRLQARVEALKGVIKTQASRLRMVHRGEKIAFYELRLDVADKLLAATEQVERNHDDAMIDAIRRTSKHVDSMTPEEVQDFLDEPAAAEQEGK